MNEYLDPNSDIIQRVTKEYPNGFSANGLATMVKIESSGNPHAVSSGGGYVGLCQIGLSVFNEYGPKHGTRLNPEDNLMCAAHLGQLNAALLKHVLGRQPSDAEIYLAHQQGATGALKLIEHPNSRAGDLVGDARINGNGGHANNPAFVFIKNWENKFTTEEA